MQQQQQQQQQQPSEQLNAAWLQASSTIGTLRLAVTQASAQRILKLLRSATFSVCPARSAALARRARGTLPGLH